jgi:hypothetical protein
MATEETSIKYSVSNPLNDVEAAPSRPSHRKVSSTQDIIEEVLEEDENTMSCIGVLWHRIKIFFHFFGLPFAFLCLGLGGLINGFIKYAIFTLILDRDSKRQGGITPCNFGDGLVLILAVCWTVYVVVCMILLWVNVYKFKVYSDKSFLSEEAKRAFIVSLILGFIVSVIMLAVGVTSVTRGIQTCPETAAMPVVAGFLGLFYFTYFIMDRRTKKWLKRGLGYYFCCKTKGPGNARAAQLSVGLPKGWRAKKSKRHKDVFYYYNDITGEKQWERPTRVSTAPPIVHKKKSRASHADGHDAPHKKSKAPARHDTHFEDHSEADLSEPERA